MTMLKNRVEDGGRKVSEKIQALKDLLVIKRDLQKEMQDCLQQIFDESGGSASGNVVEFSLGKITPKPLRNIPIFWYWETTRRFSIRKEINTRTLAQYEIKNVTFNPGFMTNGLKFDDELWMLIKEEKCAA